MTSPRLDVTIGANVQLDTAFREGIADAQRFAEKLKQELVQRTQQIGAALAQGIMTPAQAAAAGAQAGRDYARALQQEIRSFKAEGGLGGATGDGYLAGLASQAKDLEQASVSAASGITGLRRPLTALADSALGVAGPVGQVASRLGLMALGGNLATAVVAGIVAVGLAYEVMTHRAHEAQKEIDESASRIEHLRNAANSPIQFDIDIKHAQTKIDELMASADRWRRLAEAFDPSTKGGVTGNLGYDATHALGGVLNAVTFGAAGKVVSQFADNKADDATLQANRTNAGLAEAPAEQAKREAQDLARVITERVADNAQRARAVEIIKEERAEVARLQALQGGSDAERRQRTHDIGEAAQTAHLLEQAFDGVAKKVKAADDALARLHERQQSARDAFQSLIASETPGTADNDGAKLKAEADKAKAAGLSDAVVAGYVDAFDAAQAQKMAEASRKLTAELRAQLAGTVDAILTPARQALAEFDRMIDEKRREGVTADPAVVAQLREQKAALADAADEAKRLHEHLAEIGDNLSSHGGAIPAMRALDEELDRARAAVDATKAGTEAHTAALERLKTVQAAVATLQSKTATDTERAAAAAKLVESGTQHVAGAIAAAAIAAAGLATAFLGANNEITQMLAGVAAAATGIEKLAGAATKAGGLGKLLSTGKGLASIIPDIGGIVTGVGGVVSAIEGLISAHKKAKEAAEAMAKAQLEAANNAHATMLGVVGTTTNDLNVREARAQGRDADAAAIERALAEDQEWAKLVSAGVPQETLDRLRQVQQEEDAHAAALAAEAAAQQAAAEAAAAFTAAIEQLNTRLSDVALLADVFGKSTDDIFKSLDVARHAFPAFADQIAALVTGVDFTTAAGQDRFRSNVSEFVQRILDTAGLTDATRPLLQFLDTLEHSLPALAGAAQTVQAQLAAAAKQFPAFADGIAALVKGIDLNTTGGLASFRANVSDFVQRLLGASDVTDATGPLIEFLNDLLLNVPALADAAQSASSAVAGAAGSLGGLAAAAKSVAQTIGDIVSRTQSDGQLLGLTPQQIAQRTLDQFNANPDIVGLFGKTNLNDVSGIDKQRQHAIDILTSTPDGPAADAARQFLQYANSIRGIFVTGEPGATPTKEGGRLGAEAQSLTQAEGVTLVDIERSLYATAVDQLHEIQGLRSDFAHLFGPQAPLVPPSLPASLLRGGAGDVVINLDFSVGSVTLQGAGASSGASGATSASDLERALAAAVTLPNSPLRRALDQALGDDVRAGKLRFGGRVV